MVTLPFCLFPLPFSLPYSASLARFPRGALPGGASAAHSIMLCVTGSWILTLILCRAPSCVANVSSKRGKRRITSPLCCFNCEDDPRPACLSKSCESWELPACFYPRAQLVELPAVGDQSERPWRLCLLLVWKAQCSDLGPQDPLGCLQRRIEEPDVWTSSFTLWLVFHQVAAEPACILHLFHDVALLASTACHTSQTPSLTRVSSCVEGFRCTWVINSVTSASTASSPIRCCVLRTSLDEAPLLLAAFLLPLSGAPPVCCSP